MSKLSTTPSSVEIASTQTVPLAIDFTSQVGAGDAVSAPVVTVTDLVSGADVTATVVRANPAPSVAGNVVTVYVENLQPNTRYRLVCTVTLAANKEGAAELLLYCPF